MNRKTAVKAISEAQWSFSASSARMTTPHMRKTLVYFSHHPAFSHSLSMRAHAHFPCCHCSGLSIKTSAVHCR